MDDVVLLMRRLPMAVLQEQDRIREEKKKAEEAAKQDQDKAATEEVRLV